MDVKDLVPVYSAAVGALAGLGGAIVTAVITSTRERTLRKEERLAAKEDRRDKYQRDTLLALQEALTDLMRANTQTYLADKRAHRVSGEWHEMALPNDIDEKVRETHRLTTLLTERVLDDEVRDGMNRTKEFASAMVMANEPATAEHLFVKVQEAAQDTHRRIGKVLRAIDAP
jgi:hypothetical protein